MKAATFKLLRSQLGKINSNKELAKSKQLSTYVKRALRGRESEQEGGGRGEAVGRAAKLLLRYTTKLKHMRSQNT